MRDHDRLPTPGVRAETVADTMGPDPLPVEVLCGPFLCRLRVWSDAEWDALPPHGRPPQAEYFPGLGWVGAVPVGGLN
jgi:hypothetical protein